MDSTVLGFALLVSIMSAVVFGMLPALQASRPDVIDALKDSSRGTTVGPSRRMLRSAFVVAQIATALVLLIGAGLMINSFLRLYTVNVGFNPHNVMTFQIRFAGAQYYGYTGNSAPNGSPEIALSERVNAVSEQIRQRLAGVAGVESSSAVAVIPPLSGGARVYPFTIEGQQPASSEAGGLTAEWFPVMPDYLRTLGIPVLRGRDFTAQDSAAAASVALISTTMAKRFFPNENPIGKRIQIDYYKDKPREIVGVVGDSRHNSRDQNFQPQIYVPYAQLPLVNDASGSGLERLAFLVRFKGSPNQLASSLRSAVGEVDPAQAQAAVNFKLLDELLADQLQGFLQYVLLLGVFAGIALVLAIAGIYGMMAHVVSQRTGELGIRIALGARRADVMALVLSRGLVLIAVGLTMGLGASLMLTRVIQSVLWGVTPTDPLTFAVVALLLAAIALLACYLPARRAAKTDPVVALRCE
jgi:putative ABC transport system permease protein